ncbi:MAG: hypothetical protein IPM64_17250 [Phycisphaerales bacterium]|nr:hypothetical protein [Phycisphaerales bacterium]
MNSTLRIFGDVGGLPLDSTLILEASGRRSDVIAPNAAKTATLTTRSSDSAGTLTVGSGHGITTGSTIDLYWAGGSRHNVTVGTVSGTNVPISSGAGDALPLQGEDTCLACVVKTLDVDFDAAKLEAMALTCANRAIVTFFDENDAIIASIVLPGGEPHLWYASSGFDGPLGTSDQIAYAQVTSVATSPGSSDAIGLGLLIDSA